MQKRVYTYVLLGVALAATAAPTYAGDMGWHGLEVRGGATFPSDWDQGYTLGLSADLGRIVGGLRLVPGISYAEGETSATDFFGVRFDRDISVLALGADVRYHFTGDETGFYVGGGPYLHRVERTIRTSTNRPIASVTTTSDSIAVQGVGGYRFGSRFAVEGRYSTLSQFSGFQALVSIRFGGP